MIYILTLTELLEMEVGAGASDDAAEILMRAQETAQKHGAQLILFDPMDQNFVHALPGTVVLVDPSVEGAVVGSRDAIGLFLTTGSPLTDVEFEEADVGTPGDN